MSLQTIDPVAAKRLIDEGAVLVDIREADEHARERVPGARNQPLSRLGPLPTASAKAVDLPLPIRRADRGQCAAPRRRHRLRSLYPRRRHRRLEEGRTARSRPTAASRSKSCAKSRSPPAGWSLLGVILGVWVAPGVPRPLGFRRLRPGVCRYKRLVRHGQAARH